jgi:hypothetical protein
MYEQGPVDMELLLIRTNVKNHHALTDRSTMTFSQSLDISIYEILITMWMSSFPKLTTEPLFPKWLSGVTGDDVEKCVEKDRRKYRWLITIDDHPSGCWQ